MVKRENCLPWELSATDIAATSPLGLAATYPASPSSLSPEPLSHSSLSPNSSCSSSLSPGSLSPASPAEQTLIFIPQDDGGDSARHLALPSDLSPFPGSVLPASSASATMATSSLPSLPPASFSSASLQSVPVQLNSILNQKVQIRPKPKSVCSVAGAGLPGSIVTTVPVTVNGRASLSMSQVVPKMGLKPVSVKPGGWILMQHESKTSR